MTRLRRTFLSLYFAFLDSVYCRFTKEVVELVQLSSNELTQTGSLKWGRIKSSVSSEPQNSWEMPRGDRPNDGLLLYTVSNEVILVVL